MAEHSKSTRSLEKKERRPSKPWTEDEDLNLLKGVEYYGTNRWKEVSLLVEGRTRKQCRERYLNHLESSIKKTAYWSKEEDELIIKLQQQIGNKWTEISKHLPGRAPNTVKNRFFSSIAKNHPIVVSSERNTPYYKKGNDLIPSAFTPVDRSLYIVM